MDSNTATVLNSIAEKLGTTSEYLWAVLVRQAPIDGVVSIVQCAVIVFLWVAAYKIAHSIPAIIEWGDRTNNEGVLIFGTIVGILCAVALVVLSITAFCYLPYIIAAFLNPEYWALHEVLKAIGK